MRGLVLCLSMVLFGCGDDAGSGFDAASRDGMVGVDGGVSSADAAGTGDALQATDAASTLPDASTDDGDGGMCGTIGNACTAPTMCKANQTCVYGGGGNFCTIDRPGCGGIAGATCDDGSAPICMYLTGSSMGVCVSAAEKSCICARSKPAIASECD